MKAFCTIAAKNYLPHARTLGDSLNKCCPGIPFHILLADDTEGMLDLSREKYDTVEVKNIGIPFYKDMAFKYDVIEFCTSVKPFFFEHLFDTYGYDKVVYLDPDMYVYDNLEHIFNILDDDFVVLTPHILKPYLKYEGAISEEELLFVGIYNLGFAAFNKSVQARQVLEWWKLKLKDQCFADKEDALHVDQRWIDFLPALYEKGVHILRHPGYNISHWNMHERSFSFKNEKYYVDDDFPLVIYHFSGLDPHNYKAICRKQQIFHLDTLPEYRELFEQYVEELIGNGYYELSLLPYCYSKFNNGIKIFKFQRRLYRALTLNKSLNELGINIDDPFASGLDSLYALFEKNKLIIEEYAKSLKPAPQLVNEKNIKKMILFQIMKFLKTAIGINRYYHLMNFFAEHSRFERQTFLIKK